MSAGFRAGALPGLDVSVEGGQKVATVSEKVARARRRCLIGYRDVGASCRVVHIRGWASWLLAVLLFLQLPTTALLVVVTAVPRPLVAPTYAVLVIKQLLRLLDDQGIRERDAAVAVLDSIPNSLKIHHRHTQPLAEDSPRDQHPYLEDLRLLKRVAYTAASTSPHPLGSAAKMSDDVGAALKICKDAAARHCVILKDDALPTRSLFTVLRRLLDPLGSLGGGNGRSWAFLRLHRPEKWQGGVPVKPHLRGGPPQSGLPSAVRSFATAAAVGASAGGVMLGLAHLIGRPYLLQLRELHPWLASVTTADGCCNRGVVVPADMYGPLADFLEVHKGETANDLLFDKFAFERQLPAYLLVPNMVRYIGVVRPTAAHLKHFAGALQGYPYEEQDGHVVYRDPRDFQGFWPPET